MGVRALVFGGFGDSLGARYEWEGSMTKHIADKRTAPTGSKVAQFLRLSRTPRETWHRPRGSAGSQRLVQFLRIARGREV